VKKTEWIKNFTQEYEFFDSRVHRYMSVVSVYVVR